MTISSTTSKNTYPGNASTTIFAYTFRILEDTHVKVQLKNITTGVLTTQTITTHYTVSGVNADTGGNITFVTAPTSNDIVVLTRNVPLLQGTDYVEAGSFPADSHERALDEGIMIAQQIDEELGRTIKVDEAVTGFTSTLPTPSASKYLRFNPGATAIEAVALTAGGGIDNVVDDPSPQLGGDLDCNGYNIQLDDNTGFEDDSGNGYITFQKTASAVNKWEITNASTGTSPLWKAVGTDANVDARIAPQGTGDVRLEGPLVVTGTATMESTLLVTGEIQHVGDVDNKIGFTTDTQIFTTGGSTRMDITDSGIQLGAANARVTTILDEDAMGSDSATALATQQSIKAYADSLSLGKILQVLQNSRSTVISTTSSIPADDTVPLSTEGAASGLSQAITPASTSNNVLVQVSTWVATGTVGAIATVAIFRGTTCIAVNSAEQASNIDSYPLSISVLDSPSTASPVTYTVRFGTTTGTMYLNGTTTGAERWSTAGASFLQVIEVNGV